MLDLDWERSVDILPINHKELSNIFSKFHKKLTVYDFNLISLGCRNSNYVVITNNGNYLFRMSPVGEINNEKVAYNLLNNIINIPKLLYHSAENYAHVFIYEFIDGISLQKYIIDTNRCDSDLISQVAKTAALIHNTPKDKLNDLTEINTPPFERWYEYFLSIPYIKDRLGDELFEKLRRCVINRQSLMPEIDKYVSLIHCDFRPANMLINKKFEIFFVDWEYACLGHSLADVGQFFRYRSFFSNADMVLFEKVYNEYADAKLPINWIDLSSLRDLINPMQMLSAKQEFPLKNKDLICIINKTLDYWGN